MRTIIRGGRVIDPTAAQPDVVRDLFLDGERIIPPPTDPATWSERTIEARGRVVMAGGVDVHCHIAGPLVNRTRQLTAGIPAVRYDAADYPLAMTVRDTGQRYALLGYTTAIEAAVSTTGSRQAHWELAATPQIDRGLLLLLAGYGPLLAALDANEPELATHLISQVLSRCGALGIKAVNPGGAAHWSSTEIETAKLTEPLPGHRFSPAELLRQLATAADQLALPHPVHIHCNQLGVPGNIEVTLETSRVLEGCRHHLTHVQFHTYGRNERGETTSAAEQFIEHLHATPELTADVGQVMFGRALTLSADRQIEHLLWRLTGGPYVDLEAELETGCGVVPLEYRRTTGLHALQWATGLELMLLCEDPWRLALSTDHPNGASFLAYPTLIAHLMDASLRQAALEAADSRARTASGLAGISREYTLVEVATVTRAGPARILGLSDRGHLRPGALADLTIYNDTPDRETMFRYPTHVFKSGQLIVSDGELVEMVSGETLCTAHETEPTAERYQIDWYQSHATYDYRQLGPTAEELERCAVVTPAGAPSADGAPSGGEQP